MRVAESSVRVAESSPNIAKGGLQDKGEGDILVHSQQSIAHRYVDLYTNALVLGGGHSMSDNPVVKFATNLFDNRVAK